MSPIDVRAEHWRQEQEIARAAKELERQAKRDQATKQRLRSKSLSLRFKQPRWQAWIIYPVGLYVAWECFRVVFLGGKLH